MNNQEPILPSGTTPPNTASAAPQELAKDVVKNNTNNELGDLNIEVGKASILAIIIKFLKDPQSFFSSLFGKESNDEESENKRKWEIFQNSPLFAFFEEMKETFSLTQSNTDPNIFNEKFEDTDFKKIMEFQKKSGKKYSQESLMILWSNKDALQIKNGVLVIEKKSGKFQTIDLKNNKTIAESIISKESLNKEIPKFTQSLKTSLATHFSNIPKEYKDKIPMVMEAFERKLQESVDEGHIPEFSKTRILSAIEETYSIPWYAKSTLSEKIDTFLASADGEKLKTQYKDLWVT
jgi:hypothetical protein